MNPSQKMPHFQRYVLTGLLTIIPIWLTWVVFHFLFLLLSKIGTPATKALSDTIQTSYPKLSSWMAALDPWVFSVIAVILTLLALYVLGRLATLVVGKKIIEGFDSVMNHMPFVPMVYGSTKKLLAALQQQPDQVQRVVLIEFPSKDMKVVGFVTRTLVDFHTQEKLVAVYVPTTPNPTSGYLEIVPTKCVTSTDWTMDEAMTFIISGGAVAPEKIYYAYSFDEDIPTPTETEQH